MSESYYGSNQGRDDVMKRLATNKSPTYNNGKTVDTDQQNSLHTDDKSYVNQHTPGNCPRIALGERCPYVHEPEDIDHPTTWDLQEPTDLDQDENISMLAQDIVYHWMHSPMEAETPLWDLHAEQLEEFIAENSFFKALLTKDNTPKMRREYLIATEADELAEKRVMLWCNKYLQAVHNYPENDLSLEHWIRDNREGNDE